MKKNRIIKDPDSPVRMAWDILISAAVVISVISAPLVLSLKLFGSIIFFAADIAINILFLADIFINFTTAYAENNKLVRDPKKIRSRYFRSWFFPDLIAALPLFLLHGMAFASVNRFIRFLKLIRVLKIFTLFRNLNRVSRSRVSSNALRIILMAFWLLLTAHFIACGMILAGGVPDHLTPGMKYLQSLYWTITTLATVGYGDITPDPSNPIQLIFTIFAQITGVGMYGIVIGNISNVIANIDISKSHFMERMEKINAFLRYRKISEKTVNRVNNYYNYLWESRSGHEEAEILGGLPQSIKMQLAHEIHKDIIIKVPMFKNAGPSFIRDVVLHLEPLVFTPGDYIIRKGDMGDEMFFINRGSVDVVDEDTGVIHTTLGEGEFFGEISLLLSAPRIASVRTKNYCDIYSLRKENFDRILKRHPAFAKTVKKLAEERRKKSEKH